MTAPVVPLLTRRQQDILTFIRGHYAEHGWAPSMREIADGCGLASLSSVTHQLGQLERAGWISRAPNRSRALVVLNPADGAS